MYHNVSRLTAFLKLEPQNPETALSDIDQKGFEQCSSLQWSHWDAAGHHLSLAPECRMVNRALSEEEG